MNYLNYRIALFIKKPLQGRRHCSLGFEIFPPNEWIADSMNSCDYQFTVDFLNQLIQVKREELPGFEWGCGERTTIVVEGRRAVFEDNFGWKPSFEVETVELISMMKWRKSLMEDYSPEKLSAIVAQVLKKYFHEGRGKSGEFQGIECLHEPSGIWIKIPASAGPILESTGVFEKTLVFSMRFFS